MSDQNYIDPNGNIWRFHIIIKNGKDYFQISKNDIILYQGITYSITKPNHFAFKYKSYWYFHHEFIINDQHSIKRIEMLDSLQEAYDNQDYNSFDKCLNEGIVHANMFYPISYTIDEKINIEFIKIILKYDENFDNLIALICSDIVDEQYKNFIKSLVSKALKQMKKYRNFVDKVKTKIIEETLFYEQLKNFVN